MCCYNKYYDWLDVRYWKVLMMAPLRKFFWKNKEIEAQRWRSILGIKILLFRTWINFVFNFLVLAVEVVVRILALNVIGNQDVYDNGEHSPLCEEYVIATTFRILYLLFSIGKANTKAGFLWYSYYFSSYYSSCASSDFTVWKFWPPQIFPPI